MNRRSLLLGLGAAFAAPAIVKAESLMNLWVPAKPRVITLADAHAQWLYDDTGTIVGTCKQIGQMIDFHIAHKDSVTSGNVSPATMFKVCLVENVTPYWPRPFVAA